MGLSKRGGHHLEAAERGEEFKGVERQWNPPWIKETTRRQRNKFWMESALWEQGVFWLDRTAQGVFMSKWGERRLKPL